MSASNGPTDHIADLFAQAVILIAEEKRCKEIIDALKDAFQAIHDNRMFEVSRLSHAPEPLSSSHNRWNLGIEALAKLYARTHQFIRRGIRTDEQVHALADALQAFKQNRLEGIRLEAFDGKKVVMGVKRPDYQDVLSRPMTDLTDDADVQWFCEQHGLRYIGEWWTEGLRHSDDYGAGYFKLEDLIRKAGLSGVAYDAWRPPYADDPAVVAMWDSPLSILNPWIYGDEIVAASCWPEFWSVPLYPTIRMYFSDGQKKGPHHPRSLQGRARFLKSLPELHAGMLAKPDVEMMKRMRSEAARRRQTDTRSLRQHRPNQRTSSDVRLKRAVKYLKARNMSPAAFLLMLDAPLELTAVEGGMDAYRVFLSAVHRHGIKDIRSLLLSDLDQVVCSPTEGDWGVNWSSAAIKIRTVLNAFGLEDKMTAMDVDTLFGKT